MAQLNKSRWRWPLLCALLALLFCEAAWLTFLTSGEGDLAHYECYGLTFWLGSHGASLLPQAYCSFLQPNPPQPIAFQPALHMLPLEYPPLTILLFSLPLLAPLPYYAFVFALLMTLGAGLIYWLLLHSEAHKAAPVFLLYLLLGAAGVFQERFDLLPAACTLLCLLAAERGHWRAAYIALAFGVLLKVYPIVMLPALFLTEQRYNTEQHFRRGVPLDVSRGGPGEGTPGHVAPEQRLRGGFSPGGAAPGLHAQGFPPRVLPETWACVQPIEMANGPSKKLLSVMLNVASWSWHNCLLCVGLILVVMGGFALINFQDAILSPLMYFLKRPPQIEALAGSLIWLGGHFGAPYSLGFAYGSLNINSSLARLISPVDTLLTVLGLLAVYWLQWRGRIDLAQALVGLVCVLIVTGKVFSPQYLIWLIPLLAYIFARGQTNRLWMLAWAAVSLLTTFIYIFYYSRLPDPQTAPQIIQTLPGFFELVALRNLLLAVTVLTYICGWWGARTHVIRPA